MPRYHCAPCEGNKGNASKAGPRPAGRAGQLPYASRELGRRVYDLTNNSWQSAMRCRGAPRVRRGSKTSARQPLRRRPAPSVQSAGPRYVKHCHHGHPHILKVLCHNPAQPLASDRSNRSTPRRSASGPMRLGSVSVASVPSRPGRSAPTGGRRQPQAEPDAGHGEAILDAPK